MPSRRHSLQLASVYLAISLSPLTLCAVSVDGNRYEGIGVTSRMAVISRPAACKRSDRSFTSGARPFDPNLDPLQALLNGFAGRRLSRHLSGKWRRLLRALETGFARPMTRK